MGERPGVGHGLLAAVLFWGAGATPPSSPVPRVAVRVVMSEGLDERLATAAFHELAVTWKRDGVDVLSYADGLDPSPAATVSLILSPGWPPPDAAGALGWIHFVADPNVAPAPVLMVSVGATRALVDASIYRGMPVVQRPLVLRRDLLGRALGRAAAHELGHYLLASREHTARGLMRARFGADELIAEDGDGFRLETTQRQTLGARLREFRFLSPPA